MTKRFIYQFIVGITFMIINIAIECSPLIKLYIKVKACELNIDKLLEHESLSGLESILSEDELNKLKINHCNSITKDNKP